MANLCLPDATLQAFTAALQGVVTTGVLLALLSPAPSAPVGKVDLLSLIHLQFTCGVAGDRNLPPIWVSVAQGKGKM